MRGGGGQTFKGVFNQNHLTRERNRKTERERQTDRQNLRKKGKRYKYLYFIH